MFNDWFLTALIVLLAGGGGWVLGIVAFFRTGRLLREVARLQGDAARSAMPASAPIATTAPPSAPQPAVPSPWDAPAPIPPPSRAVSPPPPKRRSFDLEEAVTARWGVWLGAAALLLAGVFLVRYAVEQSLLGPAVRCAVMALLGAGLVVSGLALARRPARALPYADQAPAALAAGGVVILFGAAYALGVLYALVPPLVGFALMAAASLVGLLVALRLGQLVAAIGIVGAFVTPALVQTTDASLPGLFAYLLFVAATSLAVVRYAAWVWLGWATTVAGAGWIVVAILSGQNDAIWAPAAFGPVLAALHLLLLPGAALDRPVGRKLAWVPVAALGVAGLLLTLADPGADTRAGVLLLGPITLAKAAQEPRLGRLPWVAVALFLALVALWGLPPWTPTGEAVLADGAVLAVLPGAWTPDALQPFLWTSFAMAMLFAGAGLAGERRPNATLNWSALTAAVPVLAVALVYARVRLFQPDAAWGAIALLLAAVLTGTATLAGRRAAQQSAGIHAAGAIAAVALGLAILLSAQWLTIALVLLLPALAWIEAKTDLPALRRVALAVAAVALVRLLLNAEVLAYVDGQPPVLNGRALAYLVAAAAFAITARMARRRADDRLVAVLEVGAAAFATALVVLEIRQWATAGLPGTPELGFTEAAAQVAAMAALASITRWLDRRADRASLRLAWMVQGTLALLGGVALIWFNPMSADAIDVGSLPVLDTLLPAYAIPAALAAIAARHAPPASRWRRVLSLYALVAAFAWITLEVRHIAHPKAMGLDEAAVDPGELWAWSGAWMAFAAALMAGGMATGQRGLRHAALAVMALVTAKVFLVDMGGLTGLWRVLSFLGLGLTLIGLGSLYGRFVTKPAEPPPAA